MNKPLDEKNRRVVEDEWQRRATAAAISAAKDVLKEHVGPRTMVGSLSENEWGWIVCGAVFGWISCKAEQAVAEGIPYDTPIRTMTIADPQPWDVGVVASILPALGEIENLPWDLPVGEWNKTEMIVFAWKIHKLIEGGIAAREEGKVDVVTRNAAREAREISAKNGGMLVAPGEEVEL